LKEQPYSFGYWLRRRRKALDLTQEALADSVSCSRFAIRKIEADERRPSRRLAERLADRLAVPQEEREAFIAAARALQSTDALAVACDPVERHVADSVAAPAASEGGTSLPAEPTMPGLTRIPFVGRTEEFGRIVSLIPRLNAGTGSVVLVEGEPGIGKSRLTREVLRRASAIGLRALHVNCYEIERSMAYQPVIELVAQAIEQSLQAILERLPPISLAEIGALVPALADRVPNLPTLSTHLPEARQVRLFHAIEQAFEAIATGGPLLIVVDDVHWVDDASLQFLHYLARHVVNRRMLLVLAYRGEEVAADARVAALLNSIRREPHAHTLLLNRLSPADTRAFLDAAENPVLQQKGLDQWLHRETEGHPFFLISILHSLLEQGALATNREWSRRAEATPFPPAGAATLPEALRESVRTRLAHVPRDARAILDAAAVLGRRFDFDTLQAVAKVPAPELLDALDALVKRQLLREEADIGLYDFSHDKVREAVYLDIGGARRRLLHQSAAEALAQLTGNEDGEMAAPLAEHYERAQQWRETVASLRRAAERSQHLFATREALRLLDRAVAIVAAHPNAVQPDERLRLFEQRGAVHAQAGHTEAAVADIERVIEAARHAGQRERERDLLIQLGMAYRRGDAYERAASCLNQALNASRAMGDERHAADTLYHLGTVAWSDGRNAKAIEYHREAVDICERLGLIDLVAVQAYHGRGEAYFSDGRPYEAIRCFERSTELARGIGDKSYESENLMMIGWASSGWMGLGDYRRTLGSCDTALAIAVAADLEWHIGPIQICRDMARAGTGSYREAWESMNATLQWLESLKLFRYQLMSCNMLGYLLLDLNLYAEAAAFFEKGLRLADRIHTMYWRPLLEANLALANMRRRDRDVRHDLEQTLAVTERNREHWHTVRCLEALAELSATHGEFEACEHFADRLLAFATAGAMRECAARAHRWRGEAYRGRKAYASAADVLQQAAVLAADVGRVRLQWDVERALVDLYRDQGLTATAQRHEASAALLADRMVSDLRGSELTFEPAAAL
jgi:tetratricopeptide (TPR) repeat protein/transcriptional regulator with XRE-family HTH domain